MTVYFDTSIVAKWYIKEPDSDAALRLRKGVRLPLTLTPLHRLELFSAWRQRVFRREMTREQAEQLTIQLETDIAAGVWHVPNDYLLAVFDRAASLTLQHTATVGARSLDTLHVAFALELGARKFITNDARQAKLARQCKLSVTTL